jgi:hypothetical protein
MAGVTRNKAIEQQLNKIRNASKHRGKGDKTSSQVLSWAEGGIPVPETVVEAAYRSSAHWGCGHERNAVAKAKKAILSVEGRASAHGGCEAEAKTPW